jgi:N-acetylmuramoyl-L-alanine amidase
VKHKILTPMIVVLVLLVLAGVGWATGFGGVGQGVSTEAIVTTTTTTSTTTTAATTTTTTSTTTTTTIPIRLVGVPNNPDPDPPAPTPSVDVGFDGEGLAIAVSGGTDVYRTAGGVPEVTAHEGLPFPVLGLEGDWLRVLDMCNDEAFIRADEARVIAAGERQTPGVGFDFSEAVIVVDPGHGGPNIGAVGRTIGLVEKELNVDISRRLRDLLLDPHVVDWETGDIYTGDDIPAARLVVMTRTEGPEGADIEAGLSYRATLANATEADVFVSIHNNAGHEVSLETPGSDVFYQSQFTSSRRFASILVEEFVRSFGEFDASWVGGSQAGAKSRLSPRDGGQYYGVLRRTEMPAVIAEGAYLSNPAEEALLATPRFRQAYAEAVYRAIVRFLITDDAGMGASFDPELWSGFAGSGAPRDTCTIPEQPDSP